MIKNAMYRTIFCTYCSRRKNSLAKITGTKVSPRELYTSPRVLAFIDYCEFRHFEWAIFSDLYGVVFRDDKLQWYDKNPDDVSNKDFVELLEQTIQRLKPYKMIKFYYEESTFHPLYRKLIDDLSNNYQVELLNILP